MTTTEAFEEMIRDKAWGKKIGLKPNTACMNITRYRSGKLSLEKIEELLSKSSYVVIQEKQWKKHTQ
jgi:adenine-specific DNA methylase